MLIYGLIKKYIQVIITCMYFWNIMLKKLSHLVYLCLCWHENIVKNKWGLGWGIKGVECLIKLN